MGGKIEGNHVWLGVLIRCVKIIKFFLGINTEKITIYLCEAISFNFTSFLPDMSAIET